MELLASSALMKLGYSWNQEDVLRPKTQQLLVKVPPSALPNGPDPGTQHQTIQIFQEEQKRANEMYQKAKNSLQTNVMIPGPPEPIFNKTDGSLSKSLPVQFLSPAEMAERSDRLYTNMKQQEYQKQFDAPVNDLSVIGDERHADSGGWAGIGLLGTPIQSAEFRHNNEIPFFGGRLTQSMDEFANTGIMENFTGQRENSRKKEEVPMSMFSPPTSNLTNPYGTSNLDGYNYDHYIVSNKRNNEAPVEKLNVGPGLNQGYTWKPSGGFQQANTRDYVLPKTTDETRVLTKPKVSYANRVISGNKIGKTGKIGLLQKYRPTSYWHQGPERFFVTTGQVQAGALRPFTKAKHTNRQQYQRSIIGTAGPTMGSKMTHQYPNVKPSRRQSYRINPVRNLRMKGPIPGIGQPNTQIPNDYGKKSWFQLRCTQRPQLKSFSKTRNYKGSLRGPIQDPNQTTRTTIKETNIHNSHKGNLAGEKHGHIYDANNVLRTTMKETSIEEERNGNLTGPDRGPIQDETQVTRTTNKETTLVQDYTGTALQPEDSGYTIKQAFMKPTERELQLASHTGGAYHKEENGYQQAGVQATTQHRDTTTIPYTGIGGPAEENALSSRDATDHSTTRSYRQDVSRGRVPTLQGPKRIPYKQMIHLTTMRTSNTVKDREPMPKNLNPTYATPSNIQSWITKQRETVPNQLISDRLDPRMLDAFRNNPFTQSLASFFWP